MRDRDTLARHRNVVLARLGGRYFHKVKQPSTLARDVTGISKFARDCDRSELRPHLPKLTGG